MLNPNLQHQKPEESKIYTRPDALTKKNEIADILRRTEELCNVRSQEIYPAKKPIIYNKKTKPF